MGLPVWGVYPEPEAIVDWLESQMCKSNELEGTTVLVTAGGTARKYRSCSLYW